MNGYCPVPLCKNPAHTFGYCMVHKVYADMEAGTLDSGTSREDGDA